MRRALVIAVCLGLASESPADSEEFKLIVNPANTAASVDREFLRDAYLKRATEWAGGGAIRPIDLSTAFSAREHFTLEILKKTPAQLRSYWNQQIFSGKGVPPPEVDSAAAAIAFVLANPGAVAYVPASVNPGRAKTLEVK